MDTTELETMYCNLVLDSMLAVQEGESLSINTEHATLDFATKIARQASEVTLQPVHIVILDHGVPQDVLAITPEDHQEAGTPPNGYVLLRLDNTEEDRNRGFSDLDEAVQDLSQLQRSGILAGPPWIREVAPWALVPVPGQSWAKRLMGNTVDALEKTWQVLSEAYKLDQPSPAKSWIEQMHLLQFRIQQLSALGSARILVDGGGNEFSFIPAPKALWHDGTCTLPNGRIFIPQLPLERVSIIPDSDSIEGTIQCTKDFHLLGGTVSNATFVFEHGRLVSFDAKRGYDILEAVLAVDAGARRIGEISFADHQQPYSRFSHRFGQAGMDANAESTVVFGAADTGHFPDIHDNIEKDDLATYYICNHSDIRMQIDTGCPQLRCTSVLPSGETYTFMANGRFL